MKTFRAITFTTLSLLSAQSLAFVECPQAKVKYVQPDSDRVYIQLEGQNWQSLGLYTEPGTDQKMSIALAALAADKEVLLRFPDGHDANCAASATTTAKMIRIIR